MIVLTLKPLAVRIPEETEKELLEIAEYENLDKATTVRDLLQRGIEEWRKKTALKMLREGKVTYMKAAEITRLPLWEFTDLVKQSGIEWIRYEVGEIEREAAEAAKEST